MNFLTSIFASLVFIAVLFMPVRADEKIFLPIIVAGKVTEEPCAPSIDFELNRIFLPLVIADKATEELYVPDAEVTLKQIFLPIIISADMAEKPCASGANLGGEQIFLPIVISGKATKEPHAPDVEFKTERKRLWHITENNGGLFATNPIVCGHKHLVQIDVFNANGSRSLPGMVIEIQHDDNGQVTTELATTESDGAVKINIGQRATVRVVKDADGKDVNSGSASVTTVTSQISAEVLQNSGYCAGESDCRDLIVNNTCQGFFSWGVVFQQSQH